MWLFVGIKELRRANYYPLIIGQVPLEKGAPTRFFQGTGEAFVVKWRSVGLCEFSSCSKDFSASNPYLQPAFFLYIKLISDYYLETKKNYLQLF